MDLDAWKKSETLHAMRESEHLALEVRFWPWI
jgi:hypothetical protein